MIYLLAGVLGCVIGYLLARIQRAKKKIKELEGALEYYHNPYGNL